MKFELKPIYLSKAILNAWPTIIEGVEKVLTYAKDDTNTDKILNDLLAGQLFLWMGFCDGEYVGFVTTQIEDRPGVGRYLWVVHAFVKTGYDIDIFKEGFNRLEQFAEQYKCQYMKFYTLRDKAFIRKLKDYGFEPSYVEMVREVGGGKIAQP